MNGKQLATVLLAAIITPTFTMAISGCSFSSQSERYVSPHIESFSAKINLDEVQKAFWDSKGKDFNSWMSAFEKRINEIYDGKEVVSIDATKQNGKLIVTGYIDTQKKQGFVPGDQKLFTIEQTGEAVNNELPYRLSDQNGQPYYEGHRSLLDNPFLQAMLISQMFGGWGNHYYTPYPRTVVLHGYRDSFRTTPRWTEQQSANHGFDSRFKTRAMGGFESRNKLGTSSFATENGGAKRSWGASGTSAPSGGSFWGGRRPSGSGSSFSGGGFSSGSGALSGGGSPFGSSYGGFRSRGWGGRRR